MQINWSLKEAIEYYKNLDAPNNQQILIEFLREVQEHNSGMLNEDILFKISDMMQIKYSFLTALIKRYPSLRLADAPHTLEICSGKNCLAKNNIALMRFIMSEYNVSSGEISVKGKFKYKIVNCLKHCGKGPNIKWDGQIYHDMTIDKLKKIIEKR